MGVLFKKLKAKFVKPEEKLHEIVPSLGQLGEELKRVVDNDDALSGIVRFFDEVSSWQDRGLSDVIFALDEVNYGQYDDVIKNLYKLQRHFEKAGRDQYGWNRTNPHEKVTPDNVFLGNIFGLFTESVKFWKDRKDEPKDAWAASGWDGPAVEGKNAYDVVSDQARKFMSYHVPKITALIEELSMV